MTIPNGFRAYNPDSDTLTPGQKVWHPVMGYPGIFIEHADCNEVRAVFSADDGCESVPEEGLCVPDVPSWSPEKWDEEMKRWQKRAGLFNEVILEVIDTIGLRYDSLFPTPDIRSDEARAIMAKALLSYAEQITGLDLKALGENRPTPIAIYSLRDAVQTHKVWGQLTVMDRFGKALERIRFARDYHAEHGEFPSGTLKRDQAFDDWAADLADEAIGNALSVGAGSLVRFRNHDHDRHGPEGVVVETYEDGRALVCSVPAPDSNPKWKYAPVGVYSIEEDLE